MSIQDLYYIFKFFHIDFNIEIVAVLNNANYFQCLIVSLYQVNTSSNRDGSTTSSSKRRSARPRDGPPQGNEARHARAAASRPRIPRCISKLTFEDMSKFLKVFFSVISISDEQIIS